MEGEHTRSRGRGKGGGRSKRGLMGLQDDSPSSLLHGVLVLCSGSLRVSYQEKEPTGGNREVRIQGGGACAEQRQLLVAGDLISSPLVLSGCPRVLCVSSLLLPCSRGSQRCSCSPPPPVSLASARAAGENLKEEGRG